MKRTRIFQLKIAVRNTCLLLVYRKNTITCGWECERERKSEKEEERQSVRKRAKTCRNSKKRCRQIYTIKYNVCEWMTINGLSNKTSNCVYNHAPRESDIVSNPAILMFASLCIFKMLMVFAVKNIYMNNLENAKLDAMKLAMMANGEREGNRRRDSKIFSKLFKKTSNKNLKTRLP